MSKKSNDKPSTLDLAALAERHGVLKDGLQDFLDDNGLYLSEQNFERAFQHLLASTSHLEDLTLYDVTNYLQQVLEHHEYVIETMNKTGLAEESLIKLIVTADSEQRRKPDAQTRKSEGVVQQAAKGWRFRITAFPLPIAVSLVLLVGIAIATPLIPSP